MDDHQAPKAGSLSVSAQGFLHGAVGDEPTGGGWFRPLRMSAAQMRALGSVTALRPGQNRAMAACTAGITLEFSTDASTIAIALRRSDVPQATRAVLADVERADPRELARLEDYAVEMDGTLHPYLQYFDSSLYIDVAGNAGRLPGFGDAHTFRVWLPALSAVELRTITCDGSFLDPVPARKTLLVLGDSIAQGFVASNPALTWPARLGALLGADVINQGVGGQVFQPHTVPRLDEDPWAAIVSLGENYRYESLPFSQIEADIRAYLAEVASALDGVPVFVASPLWHNEQVSPSRSPESLVFVRLLLEELCARHGFAFIDGAKLVDADPALFADGYEHPGDEGMAQIAQRLAYIIENALADEGARRERALDLLAREPMTAFPLAEQIRRGSGRVMVADGRAIFLKVTPTTQMLFAKDREAGRNVLASCVEPTVLCMLGRVALRDAQYILGMHRLTPCYLAVYEKDAAPAYDRALDIRVLDRSFADAVRTGYTHAGYIREGEVEALLDEGKVLGGFCGGELAGFIAERPEGAIGMLEVLPGHRGKGWGFALEAAKIEQHLAQGYVPWCQIWTDNIASIKLNEKLGMSFYPAEGMTYMNTPAYDVD